MALLFLHGDGDNRTLFAAIAAAYWRLAGFAKKPGAASEPRRR